MPALPSDKSVFINCPFDDDYSPILQAIAFTVVVLGLVPRIAPENGDSSATRLDRIVELIAGSRYAIHDISRCRSSRKGEWYRLNMPFELGIDLGCKRFGSVGHQQKKILVMETTRYDYQKALSDISGWDIECHGGTFRDAIDVVRAWLIREAGSPDIRPAAIRSGYMKFQEWYWKRELENGANEDDIRRYRNVDVIQAMLDWEAAGRPE